jgi:amidase
VLGSANMSVCSSIFQTPFISRNDITNTNQEFGGGKASTTIGLSSIGGQCQSPYIPTGVIHGTPDLSHSQPGGSSTGSAVAVAAGYAPLSIATEASGSTTTPGARTALYALVMTRETIAMEGYLAVSPTYASPGVMAKTVLDLRNLTVALLGASNAKEETLRAMPGVKEMMGGWEGVKVGAVSWDYDPIDLSETALSEEDILEEVLPPLSHLQTFSRSSR